MADLQIDIDKAVFDDIWNKIRSTLRLDLEDKLPYRACSVSYVIKAHVEDGDIRFNSPSQSQPSGSVEVRDIHILWETISLTFAVDLKEVSVGGQCILYNPITDECIERLPVRTFFGDNPDIEFTLIIPPFRSELGFEATVETYKTASDWMAKLVPASIDIDPIDVADTIADLFERLFRDALEGIIPDGPVGRQIRRILGQIVVLMRKVLDWPDKFEEYLESILNDDINLTDKLFLKKWLTNELAKNPVLVTPAQYELLEQDGSLSAVSVPITAFDATFFDNCLRVTANLS
jgi:hypothetical protein